MTPEQISNTYDGWIIVRRWAGTWVDLLVLGGAVAGLTALAGKNAALASMLGLPLLALYYPLLEGLTGRTVGKLLCGLTVVNAAGKKPGLWKAAVRTLFRLGEINLLLMGAIPAGFAVLSSPKRQRFGDMAADTYVLRVEDLAYLRAPQPAAPVSLGDFTLPADDTAPAPTERLSPFSAAAWQGRRAPLSSRNLFWPLPAALFATAMSVVLIMHGFHESKEAEKVRPASLTTKKAMASPPKEGWLQVTGCAFDLSESVYETAGYTPSDAGAAAVEAILVPLYDAVDHEGEKTPILLRTSDEKLIAVVQELIELDQDDEAKTSAWLEANAEKLIVQRDVIGTFKGSDTIAESLRPELAEMEATALTQPYVVLDESDRPAAEAAVMEMVGGAFVGFLALTFWLLTLIVAVSARRPSSRATLPPTPYLR